MQPDAVYALGAVRMRIPVRKVAALDRRLDDDRWGLDARLGFRRGCGSLRRG